MTAPSNTISALKNGSKLRRLVVGELPRELTRVRNEGRQYRRKLESAVCEVHGDISVTHAHLIDSATASTIHAGICRWLLRQRIEKMTHSDILTTSREITRAKESRDRSVKGLDLDRDNERAVWDSLYRSPPPAAPHAAASERNSTISTSQPSNTTEAVSGDSAAPQRDIV